MKLLVLFTFRASPKLETLKNLLSRDCYSHPSIRRWTQYEKTLEDAVHAYRTSGRHRNGYLGEAFMTTHTILLEQLEDPMLGHVLQYVHRNKTTLEGCYKRVCRKD